MKSTVSDLDPDGVGFDEVSRTKSRFGYKQIKMVPKTKAKL